MADLYDELFSSLRDAVRQAQEERGNQHPQPCAGLDVEQQVEVTLKEAYQGTIRLYTATTRSGHKHRADLKIPSGVDTGTRLQFAGYGKLGESGEPPGDLYLVITIRPCARFERRGDDLYHEYSANLAELALGVKVEIRTLDGRILALTVPAGTLPGQQFRLAGEGMPRLHQPECRGDLYVTVKAKLPRGVKITDQQTSREEVKPTNQQTAQEDDSGELIFIAMLLTAFFVAGIGAGLLLYWLFLG
jgi:DnaJ-class molecular chaperone